MDEDSLLEELKKIDVPVHVRRSPGDLSRHGEQGTLLSEDIRRSINAEGVQDYAAPVLLPLLTTAGTKRTCSIADMYGY